MSSIALAVAHCTFGDVIVALFTSVASATVTRRAAWPIDRAVAELIVELCVTAGWTIWAGWNAVYITRAWAYGLAMQAIAGIGLAPLLQSLVLPPIALAIVRASMFWRISG